MIFRRYTGKEERTENEAYLLNLKRFDIPKEYGGVNAIAAMKDWGSYIVEQTQKGLMEYGTEDVEFAMFFPEAHILTAAGTLCEGSPVKVGCQGVFRQDTAVGELRSLYYQPHS